MEELMKSSEISGPSISGTVTVPLAELDKMRLDHATLKKLCAELERTKMEVLVTVKEEVSGTHYDKRGNYYPVTNYKTVAVNYRGLEDVKQIIRQELIDEDIVKAEALNKELADVKVKNSDIVKELQTTSINLKAQLEQIRADKAKLEQTLTEANNLIKEQEDRLADVTNSMSFWKQNAQTLSDRLDEEKKKKGFWSFLN
jgi:chromosome segregation ATPase